MGPCGLYSPWDSPGKNTGVGTCSLLQGIFPNLGPHTACLCTAETIKSRSLTLQVDSLPAEPQGKPTGAGSPSLLQQIFPSQELGLLHCRWILNQLSYQFSSVHLLSHVRLFATSEIAARQASRSITNSQSLPKLMSIKSVMPSSHLILCCLLLLLSPVPPSIRVFSNESTLRMR